MAKSKRMLGVEDQIVNKLKTVMAMCQNAYDDLAEFIEKGKILEKFQCD